MRGKLTFILGVGVGYVIGTRAGRERFDQMVAQAQKVWESPTVQEAAGVVQAQAGRLYDQSKQVVSSRMHRMSARTSGRPGGLNGGGRTDQEAQDVAERRRQFSANAF